MTQSITYIRVGTHKRHPTPHPHWWAMGCILWSSKLWGVHCDHLSYGVSIVLFKENWPCYNGTALYIVSGHYNDVIMNAMASQIPSLTIVFSAIYSGTDQSKHQSAASLAFVRGVHRWLVNSPHKGPVTRKMFPSDDVIMQIYIMCFTYMQ